MAKVLIPTPLRQFTGKQDSVTVPGNTVGEVLNALTAQFPDLRKQIYNDEETNGTGGRKGAAKSDPPARSGPQPGPPRRWLGGR